MRSAGWGRGGGGGAPTRTRAHAHAHGGVARSGASEGCMASLSFSLPRSDEGTGGEGERDPQVRSHTNLNPHPRVDKGGYNQ